MPSPCANEQLGSPKRQGLMEPLAVRVPEACRFIGISRSKLYLLIAEGEIEIVKLGGSTLVLTESLKRLIASRRLAKDCTNSGPDI